MFLTCPTLPKSICCPQSLSTMDRWRTDGTADHRSSAYLSRNKHSYCFRIRVPVDIRHYLGKKELRYSLRTGYLGKAKLKARSLASMVQLLFQELRGGPLRFMELSDQEIQNLVLKHLEKIKAEYDKPAPFSPFGPPPLDSEHDFFGLHTCIGWPNG